MQEGKLDYEFLEHLQFGVVLMMVFGVQLNLVESGVGSERGRIRMADQERHFGTTLASGKARLRWRIRQILRHLRVRA